MRSRRAARRALGVDRISTMRRHVCALLLGSLIALCAGSVLFRGATARQEQAEQADALALSGGEPWFVAGRQIETQHGRVGEQAASTITILRSLASREEVLALRRTLERLEFGARTGPDSIDGRPAFERYIWRPPHTRTDLDATHLWPHFRRLVEERLLAWVRERDGCPSCQACNVLVRRGTACPRSQRLIQTLGHGAVETVLPVGRWC